MLADWYHGNAFSLYYQHVTPVRQDPPSSFLINGQGNFTLVNTTKEIVLQPGCNPKNDSNCQLELASTHPTNVEYGKVYRYRIINISTQTSFRFWIDGHNFTLVAIDYVPIVPVKNLASIDVAIGTYSNSSI